MKALRIRFQRLCHLLHRVAWAANIDTPAPAAALVLSGGSVRALFELFPFDAFRLQFLDYPSGRRQLRGLVNERRHIFIVVVQVSNLGLPLRYAIRIL